MRLINEGKYFSNILACFELHHDILTWKIIKRYIAYKDFVNVYITLNLHSYKEN